MTEKPTILESIEIEQASKNYEELLNKSRNKFALQKTILWQGFLASISFVFSIIFCFSIPFLIYLQHNWMALFTFLGAVYEAWWFIRKLLGCITLVLKVQK